MDSTVKILFVDNYEERLENMASAFKAKERVEVYKFENNSYYRKDFKLNDWDKVRLENHEKPDVVFRHGRDDFDDQTMTEIKPLKICYGGYGGNDPHRKEGEERFYRVIENMNYIREDEAEELLIFLKNPIEKSPGTLPSFLIPPTFNEDEEKKSSDFFEGIYKSGKDKK